MNTISRDDIRTHVLNVCLEAEFDAETIDRVEDELFKVAPLSTWRLANTVYVSTAIATDGFWALVERVTTA